MQRFRKKCKDFIRNAKISLQLQRFRKKCKDFFKTTSKISEQKFLTSGVKAHLGGLGGSEQSHLTIFSP